MSVSDNMTAEGKKLLAEINKLSKLRCKVGFRAGEATEPDGTDICDIAMWNEYGTSEIPSRPFLAQSVDNHQAEIDGFCKSALTRLTQGASADQIMRTVGAKQVALIQEEIVNGDFAPNAPSTIQKKGSDRPLIDTGHMRQSVAYVIEEK